MGAPLGVVCVDHGVHDRFSDGDRRNVPPLATADRTNLRPSQAVFIDEGNRIFDGSCQMCVNLCTVCDSTLVDAIESSGLDPGVGKVHLTVLAEEKHAANGRHAPTLVVCHQSQRLQIGPPKTPNRCERPEAALKSNASEFNSGIGCSSYASPRAKRRSSSISSRSARRLVEPIRTETARSSPSLCR